MTARRSTAVIPLGTETTSISEHVVDIQKTLEREKAAYKLTDMGTLIEGSASDLLTLAAKLCEIPFNKGVHRVVTQITLDDRRDKAVSIGDKIASVQSELMAEED